jgi:hypothetical protein
MSEVRRQMTDDRGQSLTKSEVGLRKWERKKVGSWEGGKIIEGLKDKIHKFKEIEFLQFLNS